MGTNKYLYLAVVTLGALSFLATQAEAGDAYRWTDSNGKVHYTDRPENVPEKYREKTDEIDIKPRQKISSPDSGDKKSDSGKQNRRRTPSPGPVKERQEPEIFEAQLYRGGNSYFVDTKFNGYTTEKLLIDTGASLTILSKNLAHRLGIGRLDDRPKILVSTAGGRSWIRLVRLDSVEVSGAVAEDVVVGVSSELPPSLSGLLGMTFLGDFVYQMDAPSGRLLLKPIGSNEKKYGGKSRSWWVRKYQNIVTEIKRFKEYESRARGGGARGMSEADYKKVRQFYEELYRKLDSRASNYGVPGSWRQYP
jgi:clan AA aspartic protease (TIGR02281 family)